MNVLTANAFAGELRTMFAQDEDSYLDTYFTQHPRPSASWIHDLKRDRYGQASQSLLTVSEDAPDLSAKHVSDLLTVQISRGALLF